LALAGRAAKSFLALIHHTVSLADAKAGKDLAQQVVGAELRR
jgi:hypothetical protein